jgi:hypothetical protein
MPKTTSLLPTGAFDMRTRFLKIAILFITLFLVGVSFPAIAQDAAQLAAFKQALEKAGILVQEGRMNPADTYTAFCNYQIPSGFGFNTASPYAVTPIPYAPEQTAQNYLPFTFRLRPDEAVVYVFHTPPKVKYFSCTAYMMRKWSTTLGAQKQVYASLGDTINIESISTAGTPYGAPGDVFNQLTMVIMTADQNVDAVVRNAARSAGYNEGIINTMVIPSQTVRMGVDETGDEFSFLLRTALFDDPSQKDPYFASLQNAGVFRLTPTSQRSLKPFPSPTLRVRGSGVTEFDYMDDMETLKQSILSRFPEHSFQMLDTKQWLVEGAEGIQREIDVLGENRDAAYIRSDDFTLQSGEFIMMYGVLHALTDKATYTNINLYDGSTLENGEKANISVTSASGVSDLPGTAWDYLPNNPNSDKLYVYKVARDCRGDANCLQVPTGLCPRAKMETLYLVFRAYLEPGRKVGPAYNEIVFDRAIKFSPAPR